MNNKKETITLFQFIVGIFFYSAGLASIVIALGRERYYTAIFAVVITVVYIFFSIDNMKGYILKLKK
jgi:uncharacterized membrane protein YiaA